MGSYISRPPLLFPVCSLGVSHYEPLTILILAPSLFNRFAKSSYPRLIEYTSLNTEVPLAASIAIKRIVAGRSAGGQINSFGLNSVGPLI